MFTRKQYKKIYKDIGLQKDQVIKLTDALEEMMTFVSRRSNLPHISEKHSAFYSGWSEGLNAAFHFIYGTLHEHDYFEEEEDGDG